MVFMNSFRYIPDSIDIKIKATHFGYVNKNYLLYTDRAAVNGISSWTNPYKKPQLVGHDKTSDPIGRVYNAEIVRSDSQDEPPNYIRLYVRITDKDSIEKIMDGRYDTVSVGSSASRVICSECGTVITEDGLCEHKRGTLGDNRMPIYWLVDEIEYVEDSFVNEPADQFAGIEEINVGTGFMPYDDFLDNRMSVLTSSKEINDMSIKRLTKEQRENLHESVFCGPNRSFPAHDKVHVEAGLKLIDKVELPEETKGKIKATLYRKGKKFGIVPTSDQLEACPDILTVRMTDEFSEEESQKITDFFKESPDADLPKIDTEDSTEDIADDTSEENHKEIEKMKKEELRDLVSKLQKDLEDAKISHKEALQVRDERISKLEKSIEDKKTLLVQKDNEIDKYVDENALLDKKFRDSVISNIVDLKMTDNTNEERDLLKKKLSKRQTESLLDTLEDLRSEEISFNDESQVEDPTIQIDDNKNSGNGQNKDGQKKDRFDLFYKERNAEAE